MFVDGAVTGLVHEEDEGDVVISAAASVDGPVHEHWMGSMFVEGSVTGKVEEHDDGDLVIGAGAVLSDDAEENDAGSVSVAGSVGRNVDEYSDGDIDVLAGAAITGDVQERSWGNLTVIGPSWIGGTTYRATSDGDMTSAPMPWSTAMPTRIRRASASSIQVRRSTGRDCTPASPDDVAGRHRLRRLTSHARPRAARAITDCDARSRADRRRRVPVVVSASAPSIGYDEFGTWFDEFRTSTLEPGLALALASLERELADALNDRDLARIRNIAGRVKSKRRVWRKLSQPHYFEQIARVEDIPEVIDDLIGMRITCTNLRDLEMVQVALDNLPRNPRADHPLVLDQATERDYVETPKESGYRGWHVNLGVSVNGTPVTCELQVRTLLQDSWGELTHEDSYSKDKELPPLVEVLSKRMADLLATLDDIAEDLRSEVDRIEESLVAEPAADGGSGPFAHRRRGTRRRPTRLRSRC